MTGKIKSAVLKMFLFYFSAPVLYGGEAGYPRDGFLPQVNPVALSRPEIWSWEDYRSPFVSFQSFMREWEKLGLTAYQNSGTDFWKLAQSDPNTFAYTWNQIRRLSGVEGYVPVIHPEGPARLYVSPDGKTRTPKTSRHGCYASPDNVERAVNLIKQMVTNQSFKKVILNREGKYIISLTDEPSLGVSEDDMIMCDYSEAARNQFQEYLRNKYGIIGDLNRKISGKYSCFDAIEPPYWNQRFDNPFLWKLWMDYRAWSIGEFYKNVQDALDREKIPVWVMHDIQGSAIHQGMLLGMRFIDMCRSSAVLQTEVFHPEHPYSHLSYAAVDRLKTWIDRPCVPMLHPITVQGFTTGRDRSPTWYIDFMNRTLGTVICHDIQGISHWQYPFGEQTYENRQLCTPVYLPFQDKMLDEMRWWHLLIKNNPRFFLKAKPYMPRIAVLHPWTSSLYYWYTLSPAKFDLLWGAKALYESHYPFHILDEVEVASGALKDYDVLYLFSAERIPEEVGDEIVKFYRKGGYIFADCNSMSIDVAGKPTNYQSTILGIKEKRFYSPFSSDERYGKYDLSAIPRKPMGLLDFSTGDVVSQDTREIIYGDVMTAAKSAGSGKVLATFNKEPVVISGNRTLWVGFRPGQNICLTCSAECVWSEPEIGARRVPLSTSGGKSLTEGAYGYGIHSGLITWIAGMAGVKKPVEVWRENIEDKKKIAVDITVNTRIDPETNVWLISLVNHENQAQVYNSKTFSFEPTSVTVQLSEECRGFTVIDLTAAVSVEENTDCNFELPILPYRSRLLVVGSPESTRPWQEWAEEHKGLILETIDGNR